VWETQGPITDRPSEHLGAADTGIAMWRKILKDQIEAVRRGDDPIALVRDPKKNQIIELGPSRALMGDRFAPKPFEGWGNGEMWESPSVWFLHNAAPAQAGRPGDWEP